MLGKLAELMFVEILRQYMQQLPAGQHGWLAGLNDVHVGKALRLMQASPTHEWRVSELAREAGISRSVLADRFTELIGESPMRYLAGWRVQLAKQMMRDGDSSIAEIAAHVGYEPEAAFNRAFKRSAGSPPAAWRRGMTSVLVSAVALLLIAQPCTVLASIARGECPEDQKQALETNTGYKQTLRIVENLIHRVVEFAISNSLNLVGEDALLVRFLQDNFPYSGGINCAVRIRVAPYKFHNYLRFRSIMRGPQCLEFFPELSRGSVIQRCERPIRRPVVLTKELHHFSRREWVSDVVVAARHLKI